MMQVAKGKEKTSLEQQKIGSNLSYICTKFKRRTFEKATF
jgi:hypothetical protein